MNERWASIWMACVLIGLGTMLDSVNLVRGVTTGWERAAPIESDNAGNALGPAIATSSYGDAAAVWVQGDGLRTNIWANEWSLRDASWGTPTLIETVNWGDAQRPQVAMDPSGNALAVWDQFDGAKTDIWANRYVVGQGWQMATLIEFDDVSGAIAPRIAVDSQGNGIAVWQHYDGTRFNIKANRYAVGAGWGTEVLIETDNTGAATFPRIAMDPAGDGIAVWQQFDGVQLSVFGNRYAMASGWGSAMPLETSNAGGAIDPQIAMDGFGDGWAVWSQSGGSTIDLYANHYAIGVGWTGGVLIENDVRSAVLPRIASDIGGDVIVAWEQGGFARTNVSGVYYTAGVGWGAPTLLESDNAGDALEVDVAIDARGNAIAVWRQSVGFRANVYANRYGVRAASWSGVDLVETDDADDATLPRVAADSRGNAMVVWQQFDGYRSNVWANRYLADVEGPALVITSPTATLTDNPVVTVVGRTEAGARVEVNQLSIPMQPDGSFTWQVTLSEGPHLINVSAMDSEGNVNTNMISITIDTIGPQLIVSSPLNGTVTQYPTTTITGTTDPNAQVVADGIIAAVDAQGRFELQLALNGGTNSIHLQATDPAGNVAKATLEIRYDSPFVPLREQLNETNRALENVTSGLNASNARFSEITSMLVPVYVVLTFLGGWSAVLTLRGSRRNGKKRSPPAP